MKLTELLEQITALPWRSVANANHMGFRINSGSHLVVIGSMNYPDSEYARHAANVLPELVIAARQFQYSVLRNGGASQELIYRLQNALNAAEEVKDHSEQLTPQPNQPTVNMP